MAVIPFLEALENNLLVCDGAMGTLLYEKGIYINRNYDELNLVDPQLVEKIHQGYIKAGADILETNTFGANPIKLADYGLEQKTRDINRAGVKIAKEVAGDKAYVAGSVGPMTKLIHPIGKITPE